MSDALTIRGIWGEMSDETAARIFLEVRRGSPEVYREALAGAAGALRMRLPALQKLPAARQAATIRRAFTRTDLQEAGAQILIEWLTKQQQPMLRQFLDELAIAHEDGTVKEDVGPQPDATRLATAVEHLFATFPPENVRVYLAAFSMITADEWADLPALIDRAHALPIEAPADDRTAAGAQPPAPAGH